MPISRVKKLRFPFTLKFKLVPGNFLTLQVESGERGAGLAFLSLCPSWGFPTCEGNRGRLQWL